MSQHERAARAMRYLHLPSREPDAPAARRVKEMVDACIEHDVHIPCHEHMTVFDDWDDEDEVLHRISPEDPICRGFYDRYSRPLANAGSPEGRGRTAGWMGTPGSVAPGLARIVGLDQLLKVAVSTVLVPR